MEIILLEKIPYLGDFGEVVKVRPGYARNYLMPQGKALFASAAAQEDFASRRAEYAEQAAQLQEQMRCRAEKFASVHLTIAARSSEGGRLYGSVGVTEILQALAENQLEVQKNEVYLPQGPIRETGDYQIILRFNATTQVDIAVKVISAPAD